MSVYDNNLFQPPIGCSPASQNSYKIDAESLCPAIFCWF